MKGDARFHELVEALLRDFPDLIRRSEADPLGFEAIEQGEALSTADGSQTARSLVASRDLRTQKRGLEAQLDYADRRLGTLTDRRTRLVALADRLQAILDEYPGA